MPALSDVPCKILSTIRGSRIHRSGRHPVRKLTLGSSYGSHTVAIAELTSTSIVHSFGIGEGASFDLALITGFGCVVHAYDPTICSAQWVEKSVTDCRFVFSPVGLAAETGHLAVVAPSDVYDVSLSNSNGRAATAHV